jgi:hypothetical protein
MFLADPVPADTTLTAEQQKHILGGEVCMWGERINEETVDSRIWPRTLATAERLWSPQSDVDVKDMYRRLGLASLKLEDVGITHITGPTRMRRNLAGQENTWAGGLYLPAGALAAQLAPVPMSKVPKPAPVVPKPVITFTKRVGSRVVDAVIADRHRVGRLPAKWMRC